MIPGFSFDLFVAIWSYSCHSARTARDGKEKGLIILDKPSIQCTAVAFFKGHTYPLNDKNQEETGIHMIVIGDNNLCTKTL